MTRRSRLLVIRHGITANIHRGGLIDAAGMQAWRDATDSVGIADHSHPPAALVERVSQADVVIASSLPRAIESAKRLAPGRDFTVSPLFRESDSEIATWLPLRWPLLVWRIATALKWLYRILRGTDAPPAVLERASAGARLLTGLARDHDLIVVVCHRYFRRLLGRQLVADGWTREPGRHSYANWSAWEYSVEKRAKADSSLRSE